MNGGVLIMKKYLKEILILLIQLFMFYVFPLTAGPTDAMGMVFLIIVATFVLAIIIAFNSNWQHFKSESKVLVSNNHSNYICAICVYIL